MPAAVRNECSVAALYGCGVERAFRCLVNVRDVDGGGGGIVVNDEVFVTSLDRASSCERAEF